MDTVVFQRYAGGLLRRGTYRLGIGHIFRPRVTVEPIWTVASVAMSRHETTREEQHRHYVDGIPPIDISKSRQVNEYGIANMCC